MRRALSSFLVVCVSLVLQSCSGDDGSNVTADASQASFTEADLRATCDAMCRKSQACMVEEQPPGTPPRPELLQECVDGCLTIATANDGCPPVLVRAVACWNTVSCESYGSPDACVDETAAFHAECRLPTPVSTCQARVGLGEPCTMFACERGLFCDDMAGVCQAGRLEGEQCGGARVCAPGLACEWSVDLPCVPIPIEGQPCAQDEDGRFVCADGLGCFPSSAGTIPGVCAPLNDVGGECSVNERCAGDLGCDLVDGVGLCAPRRGVGESCASQAICDDTTYCDLSLSQCRPQAEAAGKPCDHSAQCGSFACVPGADGGMVCAPPPSQDAPCFMDCADGFYCDGDH